MTEWTEKYRPRHLEQMVLPDQLRAILRTAARTGDVPNLLLYGPAGTGKTTAARVLLREYFFPLEQQSHTVAVGRSPLELDVLTLNASDDRSLDMVRLQLRQFMKLAPCPANPRGLRFVVLDEFDAMTKPAQLALKMLIRDQYCDGSSNGGGGIVRFILICNYLSRIDPTLREELVCLRFNALPPAAVDAFLRQLVIAEGLNSDEIATSDAQLTELRIQHGGSDLRAMLHTLQGGIGCGGALLHTHAHSSSSSGTEETNARLRECVVARGDVSADTWTDRDRRAAILLFLATDHPERTIDATVRRNALDFLLAPPPPPSSTAY